MGYNGDMRQSANPPPSTDQTQWLSFMAGHLGDVSRFESALAQALVKCDRPQDAQSLLRVLAKACLSSQFDHLGMDVTPPLTQWDRRTGQRRLLWCVGLAVMQHAQDAQDRQFGMEVLDKTKTILVYENSISSDLALKLTRACVATDNIVIVKWCANFLGKDLHEFFQAACDEHHEQLFLALAPKQAKRFDNKTLQRAIQDQNLDLVKRLLPYTVPKKNSSTALGVAVDSHMELEGLGLWSLRAKRLKEMPEHERNERLQRANEILRIIAPVTEPIDALWSRALSKQPERRERECELFLRHASSSQLLRMSNTKWLREAIPQLNALHVKRQLARLAHRPGPVTKNSRNPRM